jgi:hypothetical protein
MCAGRFVPATIYGVLGLLALFQLKHLLADFVLQGRYILDNRRYYLHPGGLLHVGIHLVLSALCLVIAGTALPVLATLLVAEGLIHYHIDWAKDNLVAARGLTPRDAAFWYGLGTDQALHQLTYVGMVAYWAAMSA